MQQALEASAQLRWTLTQTTDQLTVVVGAAARALGTAREGDKATGSAQ